MVSYRSAAFCLERSGAISDIVQPNFRDCICNSTFLYFIGHGEGPNHAYLGDYFGHESDDVAHDEGVKALEDSPSIEDHHTANIIDSIWEHDLGDDHLGEHHVERHHAGMKVKSYFGNHHPGGIMLPAETMDGIDTHWSGHLPHSQRSEYGKQSDRF